MLKLREQRIPELDGIRGLAICLVLLWHFCVLGAPLFTPTFLGQFFYYFRWSWTGVDLFFVLSGFLIASLLLEARESTNYFKTFYIRRFYRIFPLYYLLIAIYLLGIELEPHIQAITTSQLLKDRGPVWPYFLYVQNFWSAVTGHWPPHWFSVTWSLAVEEQFYIFLPFLIRWVPRRFLAWFFSLLVLLAPLIRFYLFDVPERGGIAGYMLIYCRMDSLGLGVLLAIMSKNQKVWQWLLAHVSFVYLAALVLFGSIIKFVLDGSAVATSRTMSLYGYTVFAFFYACLLLIVLLHQSGPLAAICRRRFLIYLGGISYGIYLLHQPINYLAHAIILNSLPSFANINQILVTGFSLLLTISIAHVSWRYFESALVRLGHRHSY